MLNGFRLQITTCRNFCKAIGAGALVVCFFFLAPGHLFAGGFVSPGELAQDHAELEGITRCTECHAPFASGVDAKRCINCHIEIKKQITAKHGFHARRVTRCERCHSDHKGRSFELVQLDEEHFSHASTGFKLTGEHADIECADCHTDKDSWQGLDPECASCHGDEDPHGTEMSERSLLQQCDSCHQAVDWSALPILESLFDHGSSESVDYVLTGKHKSVDCEACHTDWQFVPIEHDACLDCHADPHRSDFNEKCEDCHAGPSTWHAHRFAHDKTAYALEGQHEEVACHDCHKRSFERALAYEACEDCHKTPHGEQFDNRSCEDCHTLTHAAFETPDFDHEETDYSLTGAHRSVDCELCHEEADPTVYADLPADQCDDCHQDVHEERFSDQSCDTCHETTAWSVEDFDHSLSAFDLQGKHLDVECVDCHGSVDDDRPTGLAQSDLFSTLGSFELDFETCLSCHEEENPHDASVPAEECEDCHTAETWSVSDYDHGEAFSIAPAHETNDCKDCHGEKVAVFDDLNAECDTCHTKDRIAGHYRESDCGACHKASHWLPSSLGDFDHGITGFSLVSGHGGLDCEDCHGTDPVFGFVDPTCGGCHSQDDVHRNQLGGQCEDCHTPTHWMRSSWRHHRTGWPLRGGHKLASCQDCHATGYGGTPTECWRCHENEPRTSSPAHTGAFGKECEACHRPYNWSATIRFTP